MSAQLEKPLKRGERGPYQERLDAAEQDVEDAFSETLTIKDAEAFHARLYGAIVAAKIKAGRFDYPDVD